MTLDEIIIQIAKKENVTPDHVRREMMHAMKKGQESPDPAVQARWASIPRQGEEPTLEEIFEYLVQRVKVLSMGTVFPNSDTISEN